MLRSFLKSRFFSASIRSTSVGGQRGLISNALAEDHSEYYEQLPKKKLKQICRIQGLEATGSKYELIDRLTHDNYGVNGSHGANGYAKLDYFNIEKQKKYVEEILRNLKPLQKEEPQNDEDASIMFCFDRANNYMLVRKETIEKQGRMNDALFSPAINTIEDSESLLALLPKELAEALADPTLKKDLMEIVLDVGRRPYAWIKGDRYFMSEEDLSEQDLNSILKDLQFGQDNRAGINGSLHRISCIRNREGQFVGATLRNGRYVPGNAVLIADILYGTNLSVLFVGPPGSAKTSIIRDAARLLSENNNVVIVDTSNEIAGAGDIPHDCVGQSRRMQVRSLEEQGKVMIECVQNHTPGVLVIDEIGRPQEVKAALTCKERGVRMIASAHGDMAGLVRNTTLCDLIGGIYVVTVGDQTAKQEAKRSGGSNVSQAPKLRAERRGPPVFDVIVELQRGKHDEWQIVMNSAEAVDSILATGRYEVQIRERDSSQEGAIRVRSVEHNTNPPQASEDQLTCH
jgi:stage III sporulation protein SpoIIIAA